MNQREEILAILPTIEALPTASTEALRLAQSPDTGIAEIMEVIQHDPTLTSELLRMANSAYFAGPRQVSSLREAGVLFGTQQLIQMVLTAAVFPRASQSVQGYDLPPGALLDHMVAVAIGAEELGKSLHLKVPSHTFTAALLHDIGKIVLGTFLSIDSTPIMKRAFEDNVSFEDAEREILGIDHAEVGAKLLALWELPEEIIQVVQWHHHPEQCEESMAVHLVHIADLLSIECGFGIGIDGLNYRPSEVSVELLKINNRIMEQTMCVMIGGLHDLQGQFSKGKGGN